MSCLWTIEANPCAGGGTGVCSGRSRNVITVEMQPSLGRPTLQSSTATILLQIIVEFCQSYSVENNVLFNVCRHKGARWQFPSVAFPGMEIYVPQRQSEKACLFRIEVLQCFFPACGVLSAREENIITSYGAHPAEVQLH